MQSIFHGAVVIFNETKEWGEETIKRAGGGIYRAYLFDRNQNSRLDDMDPLVTLHPVITTPLVDDEDGRLAGVLSLFESSEVIRVRSSQISSIPAESVIDLGQDVIPRHLTRDTVIRKKIMFVRDQLSSPTKSGIVCAPFLASDAFLAIF